MKHFSHEKFQVFIGDNNISQGVTIVEVFADITNPFWSAKIYLHDSRDLVNTLPIKKRDKCRIVLGTGNILDKSEYEFNFEIYKIGDKVHYNQNSVGYTLYASCVPMMSGLTKLVNRHLVGEPTQLISSIFKELFPDYTCDAVGSNGTVNMLANNWTPFNTFGTLLKSAHKNEIADYLMFQTEDKKFEIRSIDDMYNDLIDIKFKYLPNAIGEAIDYPYLINKYQVDQFDGGINLQSGFYGSSVYSYDFTNKSFSKTDYENKEDSSKLNDGADYENQSNAKKTFQPMHQGITDSNSQLDSFNTWLPSRKAALMKLEQEKLLIQTSANMEYINWLGRSVYVELPNQDYLSKETIDERRSGKHLMTAIVFNFSKNMFLCNIEFVKREFEEQETIE